MPHTSQSHPFIFPAKYTNTLTTRNILITGCSVGICRSTAHANIVCVARRLPEITPLASEINSASTPHAKAFALRSDVCAPGAAKQTVTEAEKLLDAPVECSTRLRRRGAEGSTMRNYIV